MSPAVTGLESLVDETLAAPTGTDVGNPGVRVPTDYRRIHTGLDNPRQIALTRAGALVVAEAGHGSYRDENCQGQMCAGYSGQLVVFRNGHKRVIMDRLLSLAGRDGSFAGGLTGAGKEPGGRFLGQMNAFPDAVPPFVNGRRLGKLLGRDMPRPTHIMANVGRYEQVHNPDGEEINPNAYAVLGLGNQILVADAGGDTIYRFKGGKLSVWAHLPNPGPKVDAVPTTITRGGNGHIYVGTLWSERRGKARVLEYNRRGEVLHVYKGFTTITGVAAKADGTLYVSELFGQSCQQCPPGRVVKANTGGDGRSHMRVPFPAGIVARGDRVQVAAWSVAPATGFGGDPATSGAIWRLMF